MDKLDLFVSGISESILKDNIGDNYCIVVYSYSLLHKNRHVEFIYKTIDDFKNKVENDINKIDKMYSIEFQLWIFD